MDRTEKVITACETIIEGIENQTITTESALLQCTKIARLLNDEEALIWLQYEFGGYPRDTDGHVKKNAWEIAYKMGRGYTENGKNYIFTELASELEESISSNKAAITNFTTNGMSISGDQSVIAVNNFTKSVSNATNSIQKSILHAQKFLTQLKAKYYEYALKKYIEISFGNVATDIFKIYRTNVDNQLTSLSKETLLKLQAIEGKIEAKNPEFYSQALVTCRRLFECVAVELFDKFFPDYSDKKYKTKSGKEIDVSGDHYLNKLSAVIEKLQDKSTKKTLIGSEITYLLDWIDNLQSLQCKGVHSEITQDDAIKCIIHTYICIGDILNLVEAGDLY